MGKGKGVGLRLDDGFGEDAFAKDDVFIQELDENEFDVWFVEFVDEAVD